MTQRQLASVLFSAFGVFVVATRLPDIALHLSILLHSDPGSDAAEAGSQRTQFIISLGCALFVTLLGIAMVVLRNRLSSFLFSDGGEPLVAREAHAVALSVVGAYFVVNGVSHNLPAGQLYWPGLAQAVLGIALFFGARGLSGLWSFSRSVGRSRTGG